MMTGARSLSVLGLGLAFFLVFAPAKTLAGPSKEEAARAHYERGAILYKQADYASAWLEFSSAYQLIGKTELLFNMARCEVKTGRPVEALAHFKAYLAETPNDPDAEGIRREISELEREVKQKEQQTEQKAQSTPPLITTSESRPFPRYGTLTGAGTLVFGVITAALLGSVGQQYGQLQNSCAPNCSRDAIIPLERQAGVGYTFLSLTLLGVASTAIVLTWELRQPAQSKKERFVLGGSTAGPVLGWRY